MRTSRAGRAAGAGPVCLCALVFAPLGASGASGASRAGHAATKTVHGELPITCTVVPNLTPTVTFEIVGGIGITTIEY